MEYEMVAITEFAAVVSSLKSASDLTKAAIGLRDGAALQAKVIELQGIILSAQSSALAAQADYFSLLERVRELEKEAADANRWGAEKEKYELAEISRGSFAFVLKPTAADREPPYWLCAACYEDGRKSYLQKAQRSGGSMRVAYQCPRCQAVVETQHGVSPSSPPQKSRPSPPSGPACPKCCGPMKVIDVSPDPIFGDLGLQQHTFQCECSHIESRQIDPNQ